MHNDLVTTVDLRDGVGWGGVGWGWAGGGGRERQNRFPEADT